VSNELIESSESQEKCKKVVASFMQDVSRSAEKNTLKFYDQSMSRLNTTSTSRSSRLRFKRNRRAHAEDEDEGKKVKKKTRTGGKDENEDEDGDDDNDIDVRKSQQSNKRTKSKSKGGTNKKLKQTTHLHFAAYHTSVTQSKLLDEMFETGYMIPKKRTGQRPFTMLSFMSIYAMKRNQVETAWVDQYAENLREVKNQEDLLVKITFQDSTKMNSAATPRMQKRIGNVIKRLIIPILDSTVPHYAVLKVNIEGKECCIYNSLETVDMSIVAKNAFQYYLREESENESEWTWTYIFGKQKDGWSCGLWCIMYMHFLVMEDGKIDEFITDDITERSLQQFAYAVTWNIVVRDSILLLTDQRQFSRVEFKQLFDTTADVFTTTYLASPVKVVVGGYHSVLFELDQKTQEAVTQLVADWKGNSDRDYTEKLAPEVWSEIASRCNMFVELASGEVVKNDCEETDARVSGVVALVQVIEMAGTTEEEEPKGKEPLTDRLKIGLAVLGEFLIIMSRNIIYSILFPSDVTMNLSDQEKAEKKCELRRNIGMPDEKTFDNAWNKLKDTNEHILEDEYAAEYEYIDFVLLGAMLGASFNLWALQEEDKKCRLAAVMVDGKVLSEVTHEMVASMKSRANVFQSINRFYIDTCIHPESWKQIYDRAKAQFHFHKVPTPTKHEDDEFHYMKTVPKKR
jgi:hypothetical protein